MESLDQLVITPIILDPEIHSSQFVFLFDRLVATRSLRAFFWDMPEQDISLAKFFETYRRGNGKYVVWIELFNELVGFFTIEAKGTHKCFIGVWIEPRWRGHNTVHIARQMMHFIHTQLKIKHVYAISPWNAVSQLISRTCGGSVGVIPGFCLFNGKERDVEVFHSDASSWIQYVDFAQERMANSLSSSHKEVTNATGEPR